MDENNFLPPTHLLLSLFSVQIKTCSWCLLGKKIKRNTLLLLSAIFLLAIAFYLQWPTCFSSPSWIFLSKPCSWFVLGKKFIKCRKPQAHTVVNILVIGSIPHPQLANIDLACTFLYREKERREKIQVAITAVLADGGGRVEPENNSGASWRRGGGGGEQENNSLVYFCLFYDFLPFLFLRVTSRSNSPDRNIHRSTKLMSHAALRSLLWVKQILLPHIMYYICSYVMRNL